MRAVALIAATLAIVAAPLFQSAPAQAGTEDFTYDSWSVEYLVGVDDSGRAIAHVTQTLVPRFPDHDQNRGVVLGIKDDYQGTSINPTGLSVLDGNGNGVPFETTHEDGFFVILVGDDSYVHGQQTYVISYRLHDVIMQRDDQTADEFYWDLLSVDRQQSIDKFDASIAFSPGLAPKLNGNARCAFGGAGDETACGLTGTGTMADPLRVDPFAVEPGSGVTVAVGLEPGSVVQPAGRLPNAVRDVLPYWLSGAAAAVSAAALTVQSRLRRASSQYRGTVVAQYDVPGHLPPLIAAPLMGASGPAPAAQIVHLALLGAIRIEETESKRGKKRTQLRLIDPQRAQDPLDTEALRAIFKAMAPGEVFEVPKQSNKFAAKMQALTQHGQQAAKDRGYFTKQRSTPAMWLGIAALVLAAVTAVTVVIGLIQAPGPATLVGMIVCAAALVVGSIAIAKTRVHTPLGAEAREYLLGVKEFVRVAEADRIRMLQSPAGAERIADAGGSVVHLYEKLLPMAILTGQEKQWAKVIETRAIAEPNYVAYWYLGSGGYSAANLSSTISTFTQNLSAAATTSSSSGGSTGGISVGGGGGGGFSGGR